MRWLLAGPLLALALTALALAVGAAGEEGNATDEALSIWIYPTQPLVEGVWNSTPFYGYLANNWTANLTVEVHPQVGLGFELVPMDPPTLSELDTLINYNTYTGVYFPYYFYSLKVSAETFTTANSTYALGTCRDNDTRWWNNNTDCFDFSFFYLNISAETAAPANTTVELAFEITAWEGNITPGRLWYNHSFEINYEPTQPPLEIIMPVDEVRIDVQPSTSGRGCLEYQIYNPSAIQVLAWRHYETEPDSSLSVNPGSYPIMIAPGNFSSQTKCFQMSPRKTASSHQERVVVEVRGTDGSTSYMSAARNFTVEILPYSKPIIEWHPSIDLMQNRHFSIPVNITNNGNGYDRLYVNIANIYALTREGFRFDPLPFKVEVAPFEWAIAWLNGTAPDLTLDAEYYEFVIVVNGSYAGTNATTTQNVRVAAVPDIPAPQFGAVALVLVAVASGLRARRGSG